MPTATGRLISSGSRHGAIFSNDNGRSETYHIAIDFNLTSPDQSLECRCFALTYSDEEKLVGDCSFSGSVSGDVLKLEFRGGATMEGTLKEVRPGMSIVGGTGRWVSVESFRDWMNDTSSGGLPTHPRAYTAVPRTKSMFSVKSVVEIHLQEAQSPTTRKQIAVNRQEEQREQPTLQKLREPITKIFANMMWRSILRQVS